MKHAKPLRRSLIVILALLIGGMFYINAYHTDRIVARAALASGGQEVTLLSRTHTIDKLYPSMMGPYSNHADIHLLETGPRQLLWLTGLRAELVSRDGQSPISREFFCHSNLVFTPDKITSERTSGPFSPTQDQRLFTLIPGRLDITLPHGFGLPVY